VITCWLNTMSRSGKGGSRPWGLQHRQRVSKPMKKPLQVFRPVLHPPLRVLIRPCFHRPVAVGSATALLVVLSAVAYVRLPVALLPDLGYPALSETEEAWKSLEAI